MTEIVCDRCGEDCGKQGTVRLMVEQVRAAQPTRVIDLCVACSQAFEQWLKPVVVAPLMEDVMHKHKAYIGSMTVALPEQATTRPEWTKMVRKKPSRKKRA